ncbi:unannotated protein [freshwater metagenome]|uniref:Unannotated protein n=1 Tax=freshwater metagenome TaxID=449393 RepID=A0A6J6JAP9_9ZZZZ
MGHADVDLVQIETGRVLDDFIEQSDDGFATLKREAFLADELGLQERFEGFGLVQAIEDSHLVVVRRLLIRLFENFLEPRALFGVLNVCVFDAHSSTIRIAHESKNFTQQHGAPAGETADDELAIEIPECQSVVFDFEVGVRALLVLQRVDVGHAVSANAIGVDQFLHACGLIDLV